MVTAWCRDTGIFEYFLDDRMPNQVRMSEASLEELISGNYTSVKKGHSSEDANEPLTLAHILPFIAIYGVCMALSIIVLIVEKIGNKMTQKQERLSHNVPVAKDENEITKVVI